MNGWKTETVGTYATQGHTYERLVFVCDSGTAYADPFTGVVYGLDASGPWGPTAVASDLVASGDAVRYGSDLVAVL